MPTYVYACDACGKQFEKNQSFKDDALTTCILCQESGKVRRVLQPVGIVFKGSGWYINDSRKADTTVSTPSTAKAETKSETSTEAKPEAKPEPTAAPKAESIANTTPSPTTSSS
jgi:putative FmdB family regulatory protein